MCVAKVPEIVTKVSACFSGTSKAIIKGEWT